MIKFQLKPVPLTAHLITIYDNFRPYFNKLKNNTSLILSIFFC